jgi:hypothetical protein
MRMLATHQAVLLVNDNVRYRRLGLPLRRMTFRLRGADDGDM